MHGAARDGGDWVVNGTKHFISGADHADFFIVFIATGVDDTPKGPKKRITCFLVDRGIPASPCATATSRSAIGATRTASSNSTIAACRMRRCWARSMAGSR
jgi:alkylation response protein AidB-like acyl-CoA dehydrogenase